MIEIVCMSRGTVYSKQCCTVGWVFALVRCGIHRLNHEAKKDQSGTGLKEFGRIRISILN